MAIAFRSPAVALELLPGRESPFRKALILGAAGVFGLVAAVSPLMAAGAIVGLLMAGVILADVTLGLMVFVLVAHLEALPKLAGAVSLAKVSGMLLVISWLVALVARPHYRAWLGPRPLELALLVAFVAWAGASILWADEVAAALDSMFRFGLNLALFPVLAVAVRAPRHATGLAAALVAGAVLSATYGLAFGTAEEDRLGGAGVNPNALGLVAIIGAVLAWTLAMMPNRFHYRALAAVAGVYCTVALLLTLSRGALLGFGAALVVGFLFSGRGRRARIAPLFAVAAAMVALYFVALAPATARDRVTNAGDGSGRTVIWQVGWRMVEANPVLGVGAGNFKSSSIDYVLQPGAFARTDTVVDRPKVPHNIYLQVLAELGTIGLVLFLGVLGMVLVSAIAAAWRFARMGDVRMELLSRGMFAACTGLLVAGFFSSQIFSKPLWLMLAFCPALLGIARARSGGGSGGVPA